MELKQAISTVRRHGDALVSTPESGVRFVAVSNKATGPLDRAEEFSVTAFVDKKLTDQELKSQGFSPFLSVLSTVTGKKAGKQDVDVVETSGPVAPLVASSQSKAQRGSYGGQLPSLNPQKWFHSLRAGIGVVNPTGEYPNGLSVGTAGFYMEDDDGNLYLVSNNHVIGRSNHAADNEPVVQPGTLDLTDLELKLLPTSSEMINELQIGEIVGVVQIKFPNALATPNNRVDAAIAQLIDSGRSLEDLDRVTSGGSIQGVAAPYSVDGSTGRLRQSARVYKVGRTTGYTEGSVIGIEGVANVPYDDGVARFVDQIVVERTADNAGDFSAGGDSGSGVLNDEHRLVGLLFAGNGLHTFVNPIREVINELRVASGVDSLQVIAQ